jgi:ATP-binding cassette subfamily B protein
MNQEEQLMPKETLRIYVRAMLKSRARLLLSLLVPLGALLFTVAVPYFAGKVLAGIAQQSPSLRSSLILLGISSLLGLIFNRIGFAQFMVVQAQALTELQSLVFNRLLARSAGFHTNRISGKLVSDAIDFTRSYGDLGGAIFMNGFPFLLSVLVGLVIVAINSWMLGAFLAVVVISTVAWAYIESRQRADMRVRRLVASKKLTGHMADNIVNAQTVKMFSQEPREAVRHNELSAVLENLRIRDWQRTGRNGNNRMAALLIMQFCMVLFIIQLTRSNPETLATGIFAFTYTFMISSRLFDINALTRVIDEAFLNAAPMTNMLQEEVEIRDAPGARKLKVTKGAIDVDSVDFAYADTNQREAVFSRLSLHVQPGEKIGLVGPSGGGKSTLTRLLLRFDDVQGGSIAIDGQNIAAVTQSSLREAIAYVPQEPLLFHRSIGENIAYGRTDATQADLVKAAKKAKAHDFITSLDKGYGTIVGERGVKLSGGQRQRVAIARAILKDAPILVLDEATSALDSESEILIQEALWTLMKSRTAIVIAHRLSTIQRMDRIVVLDEGRIIEEGTHQQLLKRKGLYAKLWSHQSGGFIDG